MIAVGAKNGTQNTKNKHSSNRMRRAGKSWTCERLTTTLPHYDPQIDRYVLDLDARATMPSVKNTIVHGVRKDKHRIWLFGKTGENEFNVDMAWPLSPVQAFGFAIATLHSKS